MPIATIREQIVDRGLLLFAALALPVTAFNLARLPVIGVQPAMVLNLAIVCTVVLTAAIRQRLSFRVKSWISVSLLFLTGAGLLLNFGGNAGWPYLAFATMLCALLFGVRQALCMLAVSALALATMAWAFQAGLLTLRVDLNSYTASWTSWANALSGYLILCGVSMIAFKFLVSRLESSLALLREYNDQLEARVAERTRELQEAQARIKVLGGILPICMYCKGIRSDEGFWEQLETFIAENSEAQFSHAICEPCLHKHHPQARVSGDVVPGKRAGGTPLKK